MTALAGYWHHSGASGVRQACARMLSGQSVYGQEDNSWSDGAIALGRRIYRRLPQDRYDLGPVAGAHNATVLAADLRLDNREELADALGMGATELARRSDAAVLLAVLDRWGDAALDRLVGDFAFAAWFAREERLLLVRDPVGNRPLHYHRGKGFFAFASMPKGLHALPDVPYALNAERVADFLALSHSVGTASFFKGIERVEAGHAVTVTRDGVSARRYWNPSLAPLSLRSGDYVEAAREALDRAVRARLRGAEAGVGAHLSGGLDSAGVTATAARLLAGSGERLTAYTAVPAKGSRTFVPHGRFGDEAALAATTAALHPHIEHVLVETPGRSPLDDLDRHFFLNDRPRLNLCNALWLDAIQDEAKRRREGILLTAQYGNLTLSYAGQHLLPELLASGQLLRLTQAAWTSIRRGTPARSVAAAALGPFLPRGLWARIAERLGRNGPRQYSAINTDAAADPQLHARAAGEGLDLAWQPRRRSAQVRLADLRRFDSGIANKASLAGWGLDIRDPFTDRRLIELCLRIPTPEFMRGGEMRSLARRVLADRLPGDVLGETRRGYQCADWPDVLLRARDGIAGEVERSAGLASASATIDFGALRGRLEAWPEEWTDETLIAPYRFGMLRAVSAAHFIRKVEGANS